MQHVTILDHPLAQDALTHLRDTTTTTPDFRKYSEQISKLLIEEAAALLPVSKKPVTTPLTDTDGLVLREEIVLMTILRAGLSMLTPAMHLFPKAPVGFAGLARDEQTALAKEYYWKLPKITKQDTVLLLDPMLATGGSLLHVLKKIHTAKQIILITIVCAPEGIKTLTAAFPDIRIITAAVDEKLNDKKYIVPGLGDFGDRYFATE